MVELDTIKASDAFGSGSSPDGCTKNAQDMVFSIFLLYILRLFLYKKLSRTHYLRFLERIAGLPDKVDSSFEVLKLHRLSLDVFSFNVRAEKCYLKAGFKREGVLRDAVLNGDEYADDILMSILEDEWREIKNKRDIR